MKFRTITVYQTLRDNLALEKFSMMHCTPKHFNTAVHESLGCGVCEEQQMHFLSYLV